MNAPAQPAPPDPQEMEKASPGYGAALLEAVRRQPRQATGFAPSGLRSDTPSRLPGSRTSMASTTRPTPMPKRPKGRLLVGTLLLLVCGTGATTVWNSLFRYQAYGSVTGRIVELSAPWGGVLETVLVREGEPVRQGQLLATVFNHDLTALLAQKRDQLTIAQATLDAQVSDLRLRAQLRNDSVQQAASDYYAQWGELLEEQSRLADLIARRERAEPAGLVTQERLQTLRNEEAGQRSKVEMLSEALRELKAAVEARETGPQDLHAQLRPYAARIETLQNEIVRLRETVGLGEIRSPVNGRVIKVHRFTGEYSDPEFPIFEVLVDGSLEAVLYVSQQHSKEFHVGRVVELDVPPEPEPSRCVVTRVAGQYETVPKNIELHYRREEKLLPVYLRPVEGAEHRATLRLGSQVRLPYQSFRGFNKPGEPEASACGLTHRWAYAHQSPTVWLDRFSLFAKERQP